MNSLKVGGHQNLWTRKMLGIEMAVEVQILQQILQDLQVILQKMILRYSLWQYGLWNFPTRDTKLERFLPKNQHNKRKLLNFENWVNGEVSKTGHDFSKQSDLKIDVIKKCQ